MNNKISIRADGLQLRARLNSSDSAAALFARLPLRFAMTRWGEEYYGDIGEPLGAIEESGAREEVEVGEIAWWPPGNAFCIFFGPTPASIDEKPRAASAVNPVGIIEGDLAALKDLAHSIEVTLERGAE